MDIQKQQLLKQIEATKRETQAVVKQLDDMARELRSNSGAGFARGAVPGARQIGAAALTGSRLSAPARVHKRSGAAISDLQKTLQDFSKVVQGTSSVMRAAHDVAMKSIDNIRS